MLIDHLYLLLCDFSIYLILVCLLSICNFIKSIILGKKHCQVCFPSALFSNFVYGAF